MSRPSADYTATQTAIFAGRVTCPNCGGKGVGRVPGWREPLVTCPLCQAEMRSPFTGCTTVTATEADVFLADNLGGDSEVGTYEPTGAATTERHLRALAAYQPVQP